MDLDQSKQLNDTNHSHDYAEERLRLCLSYIKMGVWDWDIVNDVLSWDHSLYELYGVREEDFSGAYEAWEKTIHPEDKERSVQELQAALRGECELDFSFRVITGSGELKVIAGKGRVERDEEGRAIRMMGVNWDITKERRQAATILAQQASLVHSAKMASLGEMAGGMAHEINNPLAIIIAKTSRIQAMAQRGEISSEQLTKDLEQINTTCLRISKIISGLKSFSRNAQSDPFEPVNIKQVITDTLGLCEQRFLSHKVVVKTIISEDLRVLGRAAQLEQVLLNLLNNAFDAIVDTPPAWVKVSVERRGDYVHIAVSDSGKGIPPEVAQKIMNPFFTTKNVGKGTGLGLSIARGIIADHGGNLTLDQSAPNTTFQIDIPLVK